MGVEVTGNAILDRVEETLLDADNVRWSRLELAGYLAAGIRCIIGLRPDAGATHTEFACAAGTKQVIPGGHLQLIDVVRNLGGSKRAVTQVERSALDSADPDWHDATPASAIEHYIADKRDPKVFYVSPPAIAGTVIDLVTSALPAFDIGDDGTGADLDAPIPIDDLYDNPLHHFVVAYAYAKNTKRQDLVKAQTYFELFNQLLGLKRQVALSVAPFLRDQKPEGQTVEKAA